MADINIRSNAEKCVPCLLNDDQIKTKVLWEGTFRDEGKKTEIFSKSFLFPKLNRQLQGRRSKDIAKT
jgi:hypothetical protein